MMERHQVPTGKIKIGISSCLLGNAVRYDGTDKYSQHITRAFANQFELVPFCPEVAIGLGVPRPPLQLVSVGDGIRMRGVEDPRQDVTSDIQGYAQSVLPQLDKLSGYIFKCRSPSCGVEDVPVFTTDGTISARLASGLFAQAIQDLLPELPLSNEETLLDARACSDFIAQVQNYHQARQT
jgi:uncharacterized protein YbbK (DUF523 family)